MKPLAIIWWADDESKTREVIRYCPKCEADALFDIVDPEGIAHRSDGHGGFETVCGLDAEQDEWWWRI